MAQPGPWVFRTRGSAAGRTVRVQETHWFPPAAGKGSCRSGSFNPATQAPQPPGMGPRAGRALLLLLGALGALGVRTAATQGPAREYGRGRRGRGDAKPAVIRPRGPPGLGGGSSFAQPPPQPSSWESPAVGRRCVTWLPAQGLVPTRCPHSAERLSESLLPPPNLTLPGVGLCVSPGGRSWLAAL